MEEQIILNFKQAMRRLASTVTVVACRDADGARHGMTATAVTSLCIEPPALLVCVNRSSTFHSRIRSASRYSVNLLNTEQRDVSLAFGGGLKGEERFSVGQWEQNHEGTPYLSEAQATIFCSSSELKDFCTHTIFIGEVEDVRFGGAVAPLLFQDGGFARSAAFA